MCAFACLYKREREREKREERERERERERRERERRGGSRRVFCERSDVQKMRVESFGEEQNLDDF